jgi:catechol 2,3-dioxygenase-like lactoylglutathione lyase family enzyme
MTHELELMDNPTALVPELLVTDVVASLEFWVGLCGFRVVYDRPDEGFAYLRLGSANVMLDQRGIGRDWITGDLESPLGRGVNFEITVPSIEPILRRLMDAAWPLFLGPESKSYRTGDAVAVVTQFLVQDPDGYLLRFSSRASASAELTR